MGGALPLLYGALNEGIATPVCGLVRNDRILFAAHPLCHPERSEAESKDPFSQSLLLEEKVPERMRGRMRWSAKQNCTFLTPLRGYTSSVSSADSFSSRRSLSEWQCPSPTVCWSRGLHPKGTSSRYALRAPRQRARLLAMTGYFLQCARIVGAGDSTAQRLKKRISP